MAEKRKPIKARVQTFDKSEYTPQSYETMGDGLAAITQENRVKRQMKAQAKQKPKYTNI